MRLKKIKVYGFKSFVDATNVVLKGKIVGVVGPNGCGKSNVIDAVRWVMGESSAKMLRGDSMTDVIFNGSKDRKPVGKASVELLFDNSLGRIDNYYKDFAEISIQRTLTREGQSIYRINNKKVRRKDVLDLFRGTGLGPRSYSIIEQGMVSRIIEARPEELRTFVEEAAGISKYKDRRRETESRIRNTRENLERVEDIRSELLSQLRRLKRQAKAAERFKALQENKRSRRGERYVLKLRELEGLRKEDVVKVDQARNQLEASLAAQREHELRLEQLRKDQNDKQDNLNQVQANFYEISSSVSQLEQKIEHQRALATQRIAELDEIKQELKQLDEQIELDQDRLNQVEDKIKASGPALIELQAELDEVQRAFDRVADERNRWQEEWNQFNQSVQKPSHQKQVQLSLIEQIERQGKRTLAHRNQLKLELEGLDAEVQPQLLDEKQALVQDKRRIGEALEQQLQSHEQGLQRQRAEQKQRQEQLSDKRSLLQISQSRLKSLQEIQKGSLDTEDSAYEAWLSDSRLSELPMLAAKISVQAGWERAADRLLSPFLSARLDQSATNPYWRAASDQALTLVSPAAASAMNSRIDLPRLSEVVKSRDFDVESLLGVVYLATDLAEAVRYQDQLAPGQRIVTKAGSLFGPNWVSHMSEANLNTGYLVREEEIASLTKKVSAYTSELLPLSEQLETLRTTIKQTEAEIAEVRRNARANSQEQAQLEKEASRMAAQFEQKQSRRERIQQQLKEIDAHQAAEEDRLTQAKQALELASREATKLDGQKDQLAARGQQLRRDYELAMSQLKTKQNAQHQLNLEKTRQETSQASLREGVQRLSAQRDQLITKRTALESQSEQAQAPLQALDSDLSQQLDKRKQAEQSLQDTRQKMGEHEERVREQQVSLSHRLQQVATAREQLERDQMGLQSVMTRHETLVEEIKREDYDAEEVAQGLAADAELYQIEQELAQLEQKIERIGLVNLVAIEEFERQSERAEYLHQQHQDLTDALATLEAVIAKIDKETKIRFADTYNELNKQFSEFFPKLFGGGKAKLELSNDDWLTTGIEVSAQPPGKRNSHIHLLSGGEKALTAVALLFALFELNPAPFCMMDEVDAPLDDANVARFCETLKSFSERSQIVVITHNKITMQATDTLIGVTHNEPGVSRVVSVDLEDAMAMVDG